jgi:copper transport protein
MTRRHLTASVTVTFIIAAVAALAIALVPSSAEAHALLVQSDPPVNARLQDPPTFVGGTFSEDLDDRLSSLQVVDGTGERVDSGETVFGEDPKQMRTEIPETLPPGFYTVIWETLSTVDGHLIKGSFPFTVLEADGGEPSGPVFSGAVGYSGGTPRFDNVIGKWLSIVGAVTITGGIAFVTWVVRPATKDTRGEWKQRAREAARRHLYWAAWPAVGVLVLAAAVELAAQARQLGGFEFIEDVLSNQWGERWIQRQLVLGTVIIALLLARWLSGTGRDRLSESALWIALAGGSGYLLLISMVGHGPAVAGSFWAVSADFVHLVATAVWVGMLIQLGLFLLWSRNAPDKERAVLQAGHLQRFSAFAATSVLLLLATGAVSALTHISQIESVYDTAYGRALLVKLGIMALLLAVAGFNAFFLRQRAIEEEQASEALRKRLSTLVRIETGLAAVVILAAAVLIQYPTSSFVTAAEENVQTSAEAVVGYNDVQSAGDIVVDLTISPNAVGTNTYQVIIFGITDAEIGEVLQVRLRFKPPDPELGPSEIVADLVNPEINQYKAVGAFFIEPGSWEVDVDLRRREVDDVTVVFGVEVAGSTLAGGERFDLPLSAGSWATVAAVGTLLAALLMAIWATQWPRLPEALPRFLRITSGAVTVIGVAFLAVSLLPGDEVTEGNPIEPTATSIAVGKQLYEANCQQCHGIDGRGDGPQAADLPVPPADFRQHIPIHPDEFFFRVMTNGLGTVMPAFGGQLSVDERWHLLNYLQSEYSLEAQQAEGDGGGSTQ